MNNEKIELLNSYANKMEPFINDLTKPKLFLQLNEAVFLSALTQVQPVPIQKMYNFVGKEEDKPKKDRLTDRINLVA